MIEGRVSNVYYLSFSTHTLQFQIASSQKYFFENRLGFSGTFGHSRTLRTINPNLQLFTGGGRGG